MGDSIVARDVSNGGQTIAASGTYKYPIELNKNDGFFSVQPFFTGSGTLKIEYQLANTKEEPKETEWGPAVEIVAGATTKVVYPYPAAGVNIISKWQRIVFTETGTSNEIVITSAMQAMQ